MAKERAAQRRGNLDDILEILRSHMPDLRERYGVTSMGVFGSYVRGQECKKSDLDLLVEFEQAPSMFRFIELQEYLSELLRVKVDLVMQRALKPGIGQRILAEVVPV